VSRYNIKGVCKIDVFRNVLTASTIIVIAISSIEIHAKRRYFDHPVMDATRTYTATIDSAPAYFAIEARCAMPLNKVSRRTINRWRLAWDYRNASNYKYAQFAIDYSQYADGIDSPKAIVSLGQIINGYDEPQQHTELSSGMNFDIGYNSMSVEWHNGVVTVYAGSGRMFAAGSMPCLMPENNRCGIVATDSVIIAQLITESEVPLSRLLLTKWTQQSGHTLTERITLIRLV
jgi:hypothetical protein